MVVKWFILVLLSRMSFGGSVLSRLEYDEDFLKYVSKFPMDQLSQVSRKHLTEDLEFQAAILYLQSNETTRIFSNLDKLPEWVSLQRLLDGLDLNIELILEFAKLFLNSIEISKEDLKNVKPSMSSYLDDLKVHFSSPFLTLVNHVGGKVNGKDPLWLGLYQDISKDEVRVKVGKLLDTEQFQAFLQTIKVLDIPVDQGIALMYSYLGWNKSGVVSSSNT